MLTRILATKPIHGCNRIRDPTKKVVTHLERTLV
eukprot:COSAG01_NODE_54533_length_331_cov_1.107759_1_plen_33_part_10